MTQEKIKSAVYVALVIALLVVAYAAYSYSATYADSMMLRSFSVTGEAKINAVPDVAQVSIGVVTEGGNDVAKLQEQNASKMNKIIDFLKSQKIEAKDIKTSGYNLTPRYESAACRVGVVCPPPAIVGYTIRQTATVKIRDFKIIGPVLQGVVASGANSVSQLSFTFDDMDKLLGQVKGEAIKKAQAKALSMASTAGFRLGKLLSIEDYNIYQPAYGMGGAADMVAVKSMAAPAVAPVVEPGSQDLTASVILRYGIK